MPLPQVAQFTGVPNPAGGKAPGVSVQIAEGTAVKLAWKTSGANTVVIEPDVGVVAAVQKQILVTPPVPGVDYKLTAVGPDGTKSAPQTVHVSVHAPSDVISPHAQVSAGPPPSGLRPVLIEFADELFRTESALLLPEGQTPAGPGNTINGVGAIASAIFYSFTYPEKQLLVAGHTDTTGTASHNIILSEWRAFAVFCGITGDHDGFAQAAQVYEDRDGLHQVLTWAATNFGLDCAFRGNTFDQVVRFQKAFNVRKGAKQLSEDGVMGTGSWKAVAELYDEKIADELSEDLAGLAQLRAQIPLVNPPVFVGCGENHPIEAKGKDEFKSQTNRRVEALFFDPGEVPEFPCHPGPEDCHPEFCQVYDTPKCVRRVLGNADLADWTASWDRQTVKRGEVAQMVLQSPGLQDGEQVTLEVTLDGFGPIGKVTAEAKGGQVVSPWDDFFHPEFVTTTVQLKTGQPFPPVTFSFTAKRSGRTVATTASVRYSDFLKARFTFDSQVAFGPTDYMVMTPWGTRHGRTRPDGSFEEHDLPPGGVSVSLVNRRIAQRAISSVVS